MLQIFGTNFIYSINSTNQKGEKIGTAYDENNPDKKLLFKLIPSQIKDTHRLALNKLQTISHPNLLKIHHIQDLYDEVLIITDQLPNSLHHQLIFESQRKSFTKKIALQLINQISSAYLTLIENQIVLKDPKSSTIYLSTISEEQQILLHGDFELTDEPNDNSEAILNRLFFNIENEDCNLKDIIQQLKQLKHCDRMSWEQLFLVTLELLGCYEEEDLRKTISITNPVVKVNQSLIKPKEKEKKFIGTVQANNPFSGYPHHNKFNNMTMQSSIQFGKTVMHSFTPIRNSQQNNEQILTSSWNNVKQSLQNFKQKHKVENQQTDEFDNSQQINQLKQNSQDVYSPQISQQETDLGTTQIFTEENEKQYSNEIDQSSNIIQLENFKYKNILRAPVSKVESIRQMEREYKEYKKSQIKKESQLIKK